MKKFLIGLGLGVGLGLLFAPMSGEETRNNLSRPRQRSGEFGTRNLRAEPRPRAARGAIHSRYCRTRHGQGSLAARSRRAVSA